MSDRLEEILERLFPYATDPMLVKATQALQSYIDAKIIEARIDEYDALIDVWANPPHDKTGREEDYAWSARAIIESLQFLKESRIKALNHRKEG